MKPIARRALTGLLCGIISSFFLCFTLGSAGLGLALGALLGIAQVFVFFDLDGGSAIDRAMTSAALGGSSTPQLADFGLLFLSKAI